MSTYWLREISSTLTASGTGIPFYMKCLALFLKKLVGYTNEIESIGGGGSFFSYDDTGANGEFNLTSIDKDFRDSTFNDFQIGDIGKWILVIDTNKNAGIYKITARASTTTVTLDFRTGVAEYPTQTTGLTWYMFDESVGVPSTSGDYFRIRTPHSFGWEIECQYNSTDGNTGKCIRVRVSTNADWTASGKILGPIYYGTANTKTNWFYSEVDSGGEWINTMVHQATDGRYMGSCVSNLILYDTTHDNVEKIALMGCSSGAVANYGANHFIQNTTANTIGHGYGWVTRRSSQKDMYMAGITYNGQSNSFCNFAWSVNNRNTGKWDTVSGVNVILDYDSTEDLYEIIGRLKSFYLTATAVGVRTAFTDVTVKDMFHFNGGLAITWPGFTPQH
jgi:hypothetical protein